MKFELNGEFIRLGDLLKAAGLTGTGGEAKQAVQDGLVNVDRKVCTERGHKIKALDLLSASIESITCVFRRRQQPEDDPRYDGR